MFSSTCSAEKLRAVLSESYLLHVTPAAKANTRVEHRCTVSIGVTLFHDHEASPADILRRADSAMYQAKQAGGN
ncbi:diguanylate cyclase domain-containing protein, partial [Aromatoleum diolicum]